MNLEEVASNLEQIACQVRQATRFESATERRPGLTTDRVLTSALEVRTEVEELQHRAKTQVKALDSLDHDDETRGQCIAQPQNLARGVKYQVVYHPLVFSDPELLSAMKDSVEQGEDARVSRNVPSRVLIRDGEEALIVAQNYAELSRTNESAVFALLTRDPLIVGFINSSFEHTWRSGVPLSFGRVPELKSISAQERQLLTLLVAGVTDSVAAQALGVSERTVQRKLSALQLVFGVTGRFQLGARVGMLMGKDS